ncbi:MAG: AsmA-like C-terminal domain-containing protein [Deltaproteobacteria bacterium]|nr:AsmA-like C-terminal domain-containing protein [Deltaproteobacteria bacterium]
MARILKILSLIFIPILLLSAYLLFTPIDLSSYKGWLVNEIEQTTKGRVSMQRIVLKVLPSPRVLLEGFEISDSRETIFASKTIRMNLRLMPLLKRIVDVKNIAIDSPVLHVKRDKSGNINIAELLKKNVIALEVRGIKIAGGAILFRDEFAGENVYYSMRNINASFKHDYKQNKITYEVKGQGGYPSEGRVGVTAQGTSAIQLDGEIKDFGKEDFLIDGRIEAKGLNIQDYLPYLKKGQGGYPSEGRVGVKGQDGINIKTNMDVSAKYSIKGLFKSFEAIGKANYASLELDMPQVFSKKLLSNKGEMDVEIKYADKTASINIMNGIIPFPEFTVNGRLMIDRFNKEDKVVEIDIKTSAMPLQAVKGYIPVNSIPVPASAQLNMLDPKNGQLTIAGLKYSSKKPDDFSAALVLKDAGFGIKGFKKTFSNINGNLLLKKNIVGFENIRGRYGKSSIEYLNGSVKDFDKEPVIDLKAASNIDLKDMLDDLRQQQFGRQWSRTVGELKDANGFIAVTLEAWGTVQGKGQMLYKGAAALKGIDIFHKDLAFPIKGINGSLNFDNQRVKVNNLSARWEKSDFTCNGVISDFKDNPNLNLNINGMITETSAKEIFTGLKGVDIHFDSNIKFSSNISGTEDNILASLAFDTTKSNITYSTWFKKPAGYQFFAEGILHNKKTADKRESTNIEKLNIKFGKALVDINGSLQKDKTVLFIKTNDISMDDVDNVISYFKREFKSSGMASAQLKIVHEIKENKKHIDGEIRIKNAQFETVILPKRVSKADIFAKLSDSSANVVIEDFEIGRTRLSGNVDVPDTAKYFLNFNIISQYLDTADIYPPKEDSNILPLITGSGKITIKNGRFYKPAPEGLPSNGSIGGLNRGLDIAFFRTDVLMGQDTVVLKPISFTSNQGFINGGLTYYRAANSGDKPLFIANFKIEGCEAESILKNIGAKEEIISGRFDLDLELTAKRGKEKIIEGIDGGARIDAKDGRLWRFVVLSKIFSIVNILSIDELLKQGLPYKALKGSFVIKDGILSSDDITLDSSSMRMSAIGSIDMAKYTVDAKLGLHPFVTIDSIVSKIPLAGWIIGGKEKSTISMYYEIKGPLDNPNVEAVAVKSLGAGILGIFQRILEAPVEAVMPLVK